MDNKIIQEDLVRKVSDHVLTLVKNGFEFPEKMLSKYFEKDFENGLDFDSAEYAIFNWAYRVKNDEEFPEKQKIREYIFKHPQNSLLDVISINNNAMNYYKNDFENILYGDNCTVEDFLEARLDFMSAQQAREDRLKRIEEPANVKKHCPHCGSNRIYAGNYLIDVEYEVKVKYLRCRKCGSVWSNIFSRYGDQVVNTSLEKLFDMRAKTIKIQLEPKDYESALEEIENLIDSTEGTEDFDKLKRLTLLVEEYENENYPI